MTHSTLAGIARNASRVTVCQVAAHQVIADQVTAHRAATVEWQFQYLSESIGPRD